MVGIDLRFICSLMIVSAVVRLIALKIHRNSKRILINWANGPGNGLVKLFVMDHSLSQAFKAGIAPLHEYLLQGSIVDSSKEVLIHRLRGLCDNAENPPEMFTDHEMVFQMRGNQGQQPISVHLRHSLIPPEYWHLQYIGTSEMGDKSRHTLVRSCVDIGVSDTIVQFLGEMGFKLDYEFIAKGFFFHKGRMKVTVSKLYKMLQSNNTDNLEPISLSSLVELSVVATSGQDQIGEDMKNFAEQLKPLVQLEKVDHRRLQQQAAT